MLKIETIGDFCQTWKDKNDIPKFFYIVCESKIGLIYSIDKNYFLSPVF